MLPRRGGERIMNLPFAGLAPERAATVSVFALPVEGESVQVRHSPLGSQAAAFDENNLLQQRVTQADRKNPTTITSDLELAFVQLDNGASLPTLRFLEAPPAKGSNKVDMAMASLTVSKSSALFHIHC